MTPRVGIQKRAALVVGNAGYAHARKLKNAANDARGLTRKLLDLGFLVVGSADAGTGAEFGGNDLDRAAMWQRFDTFLQGLAPGDTALIFYAGHGLQVNDENYLVPTDARLDSENPLAELVPLRQWIELVARKVGARGTTIVFLDACREEPFAPQQMRRLAERTHPAGSEQAGTQVYPAIKQGFATVRVKAGEQVSPTFILFATAPGDFAYDGDEDDHSPFSSALLRHLDIRGLSIDELFKRVGIDVQRRTESKEVIQDPWRETNLKYDFFFKPRTWRPLLELVVSGLAAGLITCALLFDNAVLKAVGNPPWVWAVGLLFASVSGLGVIRWGSGRVLHAGFAVGSSMLAFVVALSILQLSLQIDMPKGKITDLSWRSFIEFRHLTDFIGNPQLLALTFLALLAGITLAVGTTLGCKPQRSVFRGFSAFTGALAAGLSLGIAAVAYVVITEWLAPSSSGGKQLVMVGLGALWYAVLGFQLGYCFTYYVPEHRP